MSSGEASNNVCLACGEQLSARAKDRRMVTSLTSSHVTASWKSFFIEALKNNKQFSILEAAFPAGEVLTSNLKNQKINMFAKNIFINLKNSCKLRR